jgi:Icc-related predicted phosphoesterase
MARRTGKLLALGGIGGAVDSLERLLQELPQTDAVAVIGDLGAPWSKQDVYRAVFKALGDSGRTAFWVPGPNDAPVRDYLRESANMEIVYPFLHGVHGTVAVGQGGHVLFAGMGGEIDDDPDTIRAEEALLRYPGWEVEYRLKVIREFDELEKVLLFATAPAHKGLHEPGSEVLAELIKTYRAQVAVVGGDQPAQERLGRTLVVCPGSVARGEYAIVDLHGDAALAAAVDTHQEAPA